MLQHIYIQNFAIIASLETAFHEGLNTITGETGAGKSILLGALGLVLGQRADTSVLLDREKKCVVEVRFSTVGNAKAKNWLQNEGLDEGDELILRREIAPNGKSRAFINDTPVNLSQLRVLTSLMVDLHQQFDTLALGDAGLQREVLDALAGNQNRLGQYRAQYQQWRRLQHELETLRQQQQQAAAEQDYHRFLLDELVEAAFRPDELENIAQELKLLSQAENIGNMLAMASHVLKNGEQPVTAQLKHLVQQLSAYTAMHPLLASLGQRLQAVQIELNDIADELENLQDEISFDEERMQLLTDRLNLGYKLQKKHGVHSTADLLAVQAALEEKLQHVFDTANLIAEKEKEIQQLQESLTLQAEEISAQRIRAAGPFLEKVNELLQQVGMPNASVKLSIQKADLNEWGCDDIALLFDANRSGRFEPVEKVASGGELSRLMLCIKSLVARAMQLPTMIFDEIDTGISGEAARRVGMLLRSLAANHQVIVITHLPQIAALGNAHFFVYKEAHDHVVQTQIRLLAPEERIEAIARMLSGNLPSEASRKTARELMQAVQHNG